ncbi:MAG TPA: PaaI family thioesterase [Caulobacteraceae bacterium]|nr:PaaI family thioesterase [Caulobacteraceae bacterium]
MSDASERAPAALTDEAVLERFRNTKTRPSGSRTLGYRMARIDQAAMTVEAEFVGDPATMANPMGRVQGGYLCAMLDEVMSAACVVASGLKAAAPTLEMKVSFIRPAMPGPMRGVGRVLRLGRQVAFTEGELYDGEGRLLAKASGTAIPTPLETFRKARGR